MDFIGPMKISRGYRNIMVIMDRFTTFMMAIPLPANFTTKDVTLVFLREYYPKYGLPESIVSDRDARFTSHFWQQLHYALKTNLIMSTTFHQETNGQVERTNKTIGQMLR